MSDKAKNVASARVGRAFEAFRGVVQTVEDAKDALLGAVPRGRAAPLPMAEALWRFESGLEEARNRMHRWRTSDTEEVWTACLTGLEESAQGAEELRLGDPPEGYEALYARLADLLEPLEAFAAAARRFRDLGS